MTANAKIDTEELAKKYAERIIGGEFFNEQEEQGSGFARMVAGELYRAGFKDYETRSRCKVASAEFHLRKEEVCVELTSSCFMGVFTIVRSYRSNF